MMLADSLDIGIWGGGVGSHTSLRWPEAERIQLEMGRLILGVKSKTASDVVRGELGLWTMRARMEYAILRYSIGGS